MTRLEFDKEYLSIQNSELNFDTKWIAIDLLREEMGYVENNRGLD